MAEARTKELGSVPMGGDALRPLGSRRRMPRRKFLGLGVGAGVMVAELAAAVATGGISLERVRRFFSPERRATGEQQKAVVFFVSAPGDQYVYNLELRVVEDRGKIVPVNLRNKPETEVKENPGEGGDKIGVLAPGTIVKKAIVVWGNDPNKPQLGQEQSLWYAFPNPQTDEIVFAHNGGFQFNPQLAKVTPFEVRR